MKKLSLLFILGVGLWGGLPGYAQTDTLGQEFERFWEEQNQAFVRYTDEQTAAFQKFKMALDQAFAQALRQDWTAYAPEKVPPSRETPKPRQSPSAPATKPLPQELPTLPPADIQPPLISPPPPRVLQLPKPATPAPTSAFSFLENEIRVPEVASFAIFLEDTPSEKAIGDFWAAMSQKPYPVLLQALWEHKENFQLSDWHFYQLLQKTAQKIYPPQSNEEVLFTWFMLLQSGYKARVGYQGTQVFLLLPFQSQVYEKTYFRLSEGLFYVVEAPRGAQLSLYIADYKYPEAQKIMQLIPSAALPPSGEAAERTLAFTYKNKKYSLSLAYQPAWARAFQHYPLTEPKVYFQVPPSALLRASWKTQLSPLLKDKSEEEALNFLLALVQFGLAYQTDQEQFGQEKPLTPDETLLYPYADCEDRAILFAWLVRDLLGLPVVGLDYPGHMATAVRLSQPIKGSYCLHQNAQYWVCDPTYLGAVVGQAMPDLVAISPQVVPLSEP